MAAAPHRHRRSFAQFVLALFIVRSLLPANGYSQEISKVFTDRSQIWHVNTDTFMEIESFRGFVWDSTERKDSARSIDSDLRFLGMIVYEANVYFKESVLSKMVLSLYNRGDVGWVKKEDFENYWSAVQNAISQWAAAAPKKAKVKRRTSKIRINRLVWNRQNTRVYLEWGNTDKHERNGVTIPFRSEFVRIRLLPRNKKASTRNGVAKSFDDDNKFISYSKARSNVTRNDSGDIFLKNIPMVNQGDKSYCAVASVSRVMGYYGKFVDQHEIAQMVETSYLGTNPELMIDLLQKLSFKLGVRVRTHQTFGFDDLVRTIENYNKLARRKRKPKLTLYKDAPLSHYYQEMDVDILTHLKTRKTAAVNRFTRDVKRHINIGIPLVWSVMLGKIKENPPTPQIVGGHMRLIIGYNVRNNMIVYTDSWGDGHEFKHMPIKDAVTITIGLYTIEPRSRRLR